MESNSQDRQLPASQRKIDQARRDGQVPRSKDLSHLAVMGTGAVALLLLAPTAFEQMRGTLAQALVFNAASVQDPADMLSRLSTFAGLGLVACVVFAAIVLSAAVAGSLAVGGWVSSTKAITPDLSRLSPFKGLGNLFSRQQLAQVVKLVLLAAILGAIGWYYVAGSIGEVVRTVLQPSPSALRALGDWLATGVGLLLLVVFATAVIDVPLQRFFHLSKLKMSHQEVKQEHKESDGDPMVRGRMRARQREIAGRRMLAAVPTADVVVTNPTHYAVAIQIGRAHV